MVTTVPPRIKRSTSAAEKAQRNEWQTLIESTLPAVVPESGVLVDEDAERADRPSPRAIVPRFW
jgi:hypothetical protein